MDHLRRALVLLCVATPLAGQGPEGTARDSARMGDFLNQVDAVPDTGRAAAGSPIFPSVWCGEVTDEPTRAQCWEAYQASLAYYRTGLTHRARVFAWQHLSTRIIFFVVLGLVLTGIYFAWLQFQQGRAAPRGAGSPPGDAGGAERHEIEISLKGIKVSSPVLGIVILALSLAFFYLYLVYVYPISEIF